jgi:hypothetical protein
MAERCLRNIARYVRPGGYLFLSGIDLDIRTKVAQELGWLPLQDLLEEIHDGDPRMKGFWPCHYGGLEPLNKRRADWRLRYASAFQLLSSGESVAGEMRAGAVSPDVFTAALHEEEFTGISDARLALGNRGCE